MICTQCNSFFKTKQIINGKIRNLCKRKYCLICSPFGRHNTRPLYTIDKQRISTNPLETQCKVCGKIYLYKRKTGTTKNRCSSCMVNNRRFKLKYNAVKNKGGACMNCGYNKCINALTFHHRNPDEKDFNIAGSHCYSWQRIKQEIEKCDLLCSNCHIEHHAIWDYKDINNIFKLTRTPIEVTPNTLII